ncbi:MAG TPA: hypothetical protein VIG73_12520 [Cerasibacillus sp.]
MEDQIKKRITELTIQINQHEKIISQLVAMIASTNQQLINLSLVNHQPIK